MKTVCDFIAHWMGALVLLVAVITLLVPQPFLVIDTWLINPFLGVIMFGMGLTLNPNDFRIVFSRPKDVIIGCLAQFTIMPLVAWLLTRVFALPPDLALGVILVGCCPGGTASNVITYLAKGDLALSVGMTATSTVLAPLLTPLLTWLMAGTLVEVDTVGMLLSILYVVIFPIVAGFLIQHYLPEFTKRSVAYLPAFSSIMIAFVVSIVVSHNAAKLLTGGLLVIIVVVLHNISGLSLGYLIGRLLGLAHPKRAAISIEVGMQNSGLASSLAITHFSMYPMAAIPGAIFSVWHNISGAFVAKLYSMEKLNIKKSSLAVLLLLFATNSMAAERVAITIENNLSSQRDAGEMVEVDAQLIANRLFGKHADIATKDIVISVEYGDTLPWQLTYDGKLIFPCPLISAKGKCRVLISEGRGPHAIPCVAGRLYTERQSDFSFENDRIAYRIYGPETQRKCERLYGYDIFNKRTDKLVLDKWYALQCDQQMWATVGKLRKMGHRDLADDVYNYGFCYHVDHGEGMDCYKVGSTLGAGTNALMCGDEMVYPWCFSKAEVLDNGPLRLTVRLTFDAVKVAGREIQETRILTLDAGSSMVKANISWSDAELFNSQSPYVQVAGIAVHKENPSAYIVNKDKGYVAYEDLGDPDIYQKRYREHQDPDKGKCFIGCLLPGAEDCKYVPLTKETSGAVGHLIVKSTPSVTMEYYFGNAWSRNEQVGIQSMADWQHYLDRFSRRIRTPLKVSVR